jgi:predicted RNase H-like HicB family nuclease
MKLRLVVEFDPITKRWSAFFPELPGCASAGATKGEAVRKAKEALRLWLETSPGSSSAEADHILDTVAESMEESTYLNSTAANRAALVQGLRDANEGKIIDVDL